MYNIPSPDPFEEDHPYDDDIETTVLAWYRLAKSYSEKALEFSKDLYQQLAIIKCKRKLTNQITRIGKTNCFYYCLNKISEEDFKDLRETLCSEIDDYERECGVFCDLIFDFEERLHNENDSDKE